MVTATSPGQRTTGSWLNNENEADQKRKGEKDDTISDHDSMSDEKSTVRNEVSSFAAFNSGKPQTINNAVYFSVNNNYTEGVKAKRRNLK